MALFESKVSGKLTVNKGFFLTLQEDFSFTQNHFRFALGKEAGDIT